MSLPAPLDAYVAHIDETLAADLPQADEAADKLTAAMRYAVLNGGKRVRGLLVLTTAEAFGQSFEAALPIAAAVEYLHAYSLVHDDLPAMDDDRLRRGQPTCHIAFDEATAILAGDALQTLAFDRLAHLSIPLPEGRQLAMIQCLTRAAGHQGMVYGQSLDMYYEQQTVSLATLAKIHRAKTGALIAASVRLGALCAPSFDETVTPTLQTFAAELGLAFQIQDDILDVTQSTEALGKPAGSDEAQQKSTYPQLLGLKKAQVHAAETATRAMHALASLPMGDAKNNLSLLARYIIERKT